jgi:hypothetical protein
MTDATIAGLATYPPRFTTIPRHTDASQDLDGKGAGPGARDMLRLCRCVSRLGCSINWHVGSHTQQGGTRTGWTPDHVPIRRVAGQTYPHPSNLCI